MRADNTRHIVAAARHRHEYTRAKAIQALRELDAAGTPVTFEAVARAAAVSRSWLYAQPDLRAEIERLRAASRRHRADPSRPGNEPPTRRCCAGSKPPTRATGTSPRKTAGCATSSPAPSASNAQPDPSNRQTLRPSSQLDNDRPVLNSPPSTGRSHVENTVRTADAQVRERQVDQAKDNPAAGGALVGVHHGRLHHSRAGCQEPDAAGRAGPRLRGRATASDSSKDRLPVASAAADGGEGHVCHDPAGAAAGRTGHHACPGSRSTGWSPAPRSG